MEDLLGLFTITETQQEKQQEKQQKILNGVVRNYFFDGRVSSEVTYKDGVYHGPYTYYQLSKNGEHLLFERGAFNNGYYMGKIQRYDEHGRIGCEYYKDGGGNYHGDYIIYNYNPNIRFIGKDRYDGSYDIPNRSGEAKYIGAHEVYIKNIGQRSGHVAQNLFPEPIK